MTNRYYFDEDYHEDARLGDGSVVRLRVALPEDRELLRRGFDRLSAESRYLRFMGRKTELTEAELEALTTVDGVEHFAMGALRPNPETGELEGVGVARFMRRPEQPEVADAAVTVVDAAQGLGLGSLLLRRLAAAARERGVLRFGGDILACNQSMRRLLADNVAMEVVASDDEVLRVLVELPSFARLMASPEDGDLLGRLLAQVAGGGLTIGIGDRLLKRR